jgi:hypothetical protein
VIDDFKGNLGDGTASVSVRHPIPEPSALEGFCLELDLLGLAEMARRKLKPGT